MTKSQRYNLFLWPLAILFLLRVLGHAMLVFFETSFLPSKEYWLSGLMPYPYLLISQIIILGILAKVLFDFTRGKGFSLKTRPFFSSVCFYFSLLYFFGMLVRFFIFGISIPVVFHWVLALFILTFSLYHRKAQYVKSVVSSSGFLGLL